MMGRQHDKRDERSDDGQPERVASASVLWARLEADRSVGRAPLRAHVRAAEEWALGCQTRPTTTSRHGTLSLN